MLGIFFCDNLDGDFCQWLASASGEPYIYTYKCIQANKDNQYSHVFLGNIIASIPGGEQEQEPKLSHMPCFQHQRRTSLA